MYEYFQVTCDLLTIVNGRNGEDGDSKPVPFPSIFEKTLSLYLSMRFLLIPRHPQGHEY